MPVRNAASTLAECIESIRAQTFPHYEVVCIDDHSSDSSSQTLRDVAAVDGRWRVVANRGHGIVDALNHGLELSLGALVARMDADDLMVAERLERQVGLLTARPDLQLVGSRVAKFPDSEILAGYREYVRWLNACVDEKEIAANIYVESPFAHPSVMFRKECVVSIGSYRDGDFPEDYELWLRLHERGHAMGKADELLLQWRESPHRASRNDPRYAREAFDRLRARYLARDERLHSGRELIVWGSGRKTRKRVDCLLREGVAISGWIDIDPDKIGRSIDGLPVHPPQWVARDDRPFVLVYVTNHGARDEIRGFLERNGYVIGDDFLPVG